jgi:mono/diheme cytochrome c family protein
MRVIWTILIFIIIVIVAFFIFIYTGKYDVAATKPHTKFTEFILNIATEQSIRSHAIGITVPPLDDESMVKTGFNHYKEMCVGCHGAPGVKPSEIAEGLYPEPPELEDEIEEMSSEELYWITKNGIKMTGMPAFGPTHSEEELWSIVAFLKQLPDLTPEEYKAMVEKEKGENLQLDPGHGHESQPEHMNEHSHGDGHEHH